MSDIVNGTLSGVIAALLAALLIGLARRTLEQLAPFTVVAGSTAMGLLLTGLAWYLSSNEILIAAVATVVTGLLGAWYLALPARRGPDGEPDESGR